MSQLVKLKARANHPIHFPGLCVHCAQPATEWLGLRKRIGRRTRIVDVPLCSQCQQQVTSLSADEERLRKLGMAAAGLMFLLTFSLSLLMTPATMDFLLRLLVALMLSLALTRLLLLLFKRSRQNAALPVKKEIAESAQIRMFSWRTVTFEFSNETFSERFRALNKPLLMDT